MTSDSKDQNDFGCSFGSSGLLNGLINTDNIKYQWNTFFINIITLLRNCYEKDINYETIIDKLKIDIENLNLYIDVYTNNKYPVKIYYYFPEYFKTTKTFSYKKNTKQNEIIYGFYYKLYKSTIDYSNKNTSSKLKSLFDIMSYQTNHKSVKTLFTDPTTQPLISLFKEGRSIKSIRPCLISNFEIDYHLKHFFYNLSILLSFSSRVLESSKDISLKVFKLNTLRFNKYSHSLFGDSTLIKSNISRKDKKRLKEIALLENWISLTDSILFKRLIKYDFLTKEDFRFHIY